jgi:hypothetical protein
MSSVLYYSKHCQYCQELITKLSRTKTKNEIHFVCIDNREKHKDGTTNIVLENGQRLLLPPNVKKVPSVLLLHHGNRVLDGIKEIWHYLKPGEAQIMDTATNANGEPQAFSFCEMGNNLSDTYSYLDMSTDELSAKGNGGLRMIHNYSTINQNQTIATPPEDYEPDKVGSVDLGKLQITRADDVRQPR